MSRVGVYGLNVILFFLLLLPIAYSDDNFTKNIEYNIVLGSSGDAVVIIEITGKGIYPIALPYDVKYPEIKKAIYVKTKYGVDLFVENKTAYLGFKTSMLTTKNNTWTFEIENVTANSATIIMPKNAELIDSDPIAKISQETLLTLNFDGLNNQRIHVEYQIIPKEEPNKTLQTILYAAIILIIFLVTLVLILYSRNKPKKGEFKASQGQYNIIRTLSHNEKIILKHLLNNEEGIKRNELEKISGLSKSSLANSLNNLEQKEIISIDKTYAVHFIKLTEWFKRL